MPYIQLSHFFLSLSFNKCLFAFDFFHKKTLILRGVNVPSKVFIHLYLPLFLYTFIILYMQTEIRLSRIFHFCSDCNSNFPKLFLFQNNFSAHLSYFFLFWLPNIPLVQIIIATFSSFFCSKNDFYNLFVKFFWLTNIYSLFRLLLQLSQAFVFVPKILFSNFFWVPNFLDIREMHPPHTFQTGN